MRDTEDQELSSDDLTLIPFLKLRGVDVRPIRNGNGRIRFYYPESATPLIEEFYGGRPTVILPEYLSELRNTRTLVYSMKRGNR